MTDNGDVHVSEAPWWRRHWPIALALAILVVVAGCVLAAIGVSVGLPRLLRARTPPASAEGVVAPTNTIAPAASPTAQPTQTATVTATSITLTATFTRTPTPTPTGTPTPTPTIALLMGPAAELLTPQTPSSHYSKPTPRAGEPIGSIPTKPAPQPALTWTPALTQMPFKVNVACSLAVNHWRYEITSVVFQLGEDASTHYVVLLGTLTNVGMRVDTFVAASMIRLRDSRGRLCSEDLACTLGIPGRYAGLSTESPDDMAPGERRFVGVCFAVPPDETSFTIVPGNMVEIWGGDRKIARSAIGTPGPQPTAAGTAEPTAGELELLALTGYQSGDLYYVEGEVKNISDEPLEWVEAVVSVYDSQGSFLASGRAYIDASTSLQPGQTSPFSVLLLYKPDMADPKVQFMSSGRIIPVKDSTPQ